MRMKHDDLPADLPALPRASLAVVLAGAGALLLLLWAGGTVA